MDIIQATDLIGQSKEPDVGNLLDWIYYHDTLSRFSVHHWRHKTLTLEAPETMHPDPRLVQTSLLAKYRPVESLFDAYFCAIADQRPIGLTASESQLRNIEPAL